MKVSVREVEPAVVMPHLPSMTVRRGHEDRKARGPAGSERHIHMAPAIWMALPPLRGMTPAVITTRPKRDHHEMHARAECLVQGGIRMSHVKVMGEIGGQRTRPRPQSRGA